MEKQLNQIKIETPKAQIPTGPYSQGIVLGNLIFAAGQIGVNKDTDLVYEDLEQQVIAAIENLEAVLVAAGGDLATVVKTTVFITDMGLFSCFNEIYNRYFKEPYPVRTCVEVSALPKGAVFEIECIAYQYLK